ncbi:MAG: ATP-binding cassette domain-containing protein, partial [Hyphomicrobiaceae bacterium]
MAKCSDEDLLPLDVHALRLTIGARHLLDGISLRLEDAGISVIMGPNGAGKSLMLRCLHGLIAPTSGQILWGTGELSPGIRLRQAMVFQRPVLLRRS